MNRLFGNKNAAPKPGLTEAIASTEARADGVTQKIKKLDTELSRYRDQMKKMGSGPGKVSTSAAEGEKRRDGERWECSSIN
jgi:charged multivesicular body protein 5